MNRRAKGLLAAGVVVAAVGLVALYLSLPYIQRRREQAQRKSVQENIKKVGIGPHLYSDEEDRSVGTPTAAEAKPGSQKQEP